MPTYLHNYIIYFQYLGFRYHGWAKQPDTKTIQGQVEKTLKYILKDQKFRILGSSRTDSMVSAEKSAFQLFMINELESMPFFLENLNLNLPEDIRALSIKKTNQKFNVINHSSQKDYYYLFSHGAKNHPFCTAIMTGFKEKLDIACMKKGAKMFEGIHNFQHYCHSLKDGSNPEREIYFSEIRENDEYSASFFPERSYIFHIRGKGFMRYQVRLMMGALLQLGNRSITIDEFEASLNTNENPIAKLVAPASGLLLKEILFDNSQSMD